MFTRSNSKPADFSIVKPTTVSWLTIEWRMIQTILTQRETRADEK